MDLCLNPAKSVPLPRNSSSTPLDLPELARINLPWLSSQVPSAWNTSECLVLSPRGQRNLTAGVVEWLEPQNKKEVQAFLGFVNFYQRFIQDFLHHACLLFDLTEKDVTWSWGPLEQMVFDTLKHAMTFGPVLLFLDNNSSFCVEANSSNFATGVVLSQQSLEDGK
ncbi:hypothetical protein E4T56_gene16491 [Termitomyces sp. T112]|nr:hypothetical protein E4T56_gene16491 [Termitomyces sp. T112]